MSTVDSKLHLDFLKFEGKTDENYLIFNMTSNTSSDHKILMDFYVNVTQDWDDLIVIPENLKKLINFFLKLFFNFRQFN